MKEIYLKLAKFKKECPTIYQGTQGYGYKYSSLVEIKKIVDPLLSDQNLVMHFLIQEDYITGVLFDLDTGDSITSSVKIHEQVKLGSMNGPQILGAQLTYYRRYLYTCMLDLVTDSDVDMQPPQKQVEQDVDTGHYLTKANYHATIQALEKGQITFDDIEEKIDDYEDNEYKQKLTKVIKLWKSQEQSTE